MTSAKSSLLKETERLDDLCLKGLHIIQDPKAFCFGMDAVLLANWVKEKPNLRYMDLCTGTGIIPLLLSAKVDPAHIDAVEIQPECADRAKRSVAWNELEKKISIFEQDLTHMSEMPEIFVPGSYDVITVNPPYMIAGHGLKNDDEGKLMARHETACTLEDVVRTGAKLLKPGGAFYMVHRPFRLAEIMTCMQKYRLEPKRMRLVYPYVDKDPNMVLIEGRRNGNPRLAVERPLIIYNRDGSYTADVPGAE